jgi:hypothetical protein
MLGGEERAMRRVIAALAVAAAGLVIVPAAEAHYVINQQATCALVNNVPTITASADFAEFGSPDQDIHVTVGVDNAVPIDQRFPYAPAGGHWSASTPSTAGDHRVYIYITWKHYGTPNDSSYGPVTVTCPTPVPPPPPPPPPVVTPPTPPPPVVIVCNTKPMPAACGTPPVKPCGCKPRPPRCVAGHYRITVQPRHINHGRVTFRLVGPHSSHVRWYVDHRRHGVRGHAWERTTHQGRRWWVYLWVPDVWTSSMWGQHRVTVTFNTPCGHRKLTMSYFNHDPLSAEAQRELARAFHV